MTNTDAIDQWSYRRPHAFAFVAIWDVWWMLEVFAFKLGVLTVIDDDRFDKMRIVELLNCCLSV